MSIRIEKKLNKLSEKMAYLRKEIEELEAQKTAKLNFKSEEIQTIVKSIQALSQKSDESVIHVLSLVQKACRGETNSVKKETSTVAPKYRDPMEYNNVWTGRGLEPLWLKRYTSNGRSRDEFLIK